MRLKKDKSGDTVGRPSWRSSLPGDPGAIFFCGKPQHMKNSLNFANTCLKVVDTRRYSPMTLSTPSRVVRCWTWPESCLRKHQGPILGVGRDTQRKAN